jgi:hypothetical protein
MNMANARIIAPIVASGKTLGRTGPEWRNDFYVGWASNAVPNTKLTNLVKVGKGLKPQYEIAERETAHREFVATLIERKAGGKTTEIAKVRIGMFGKLLDKPVKTDKQDAVAIAEVKAEELADA